jgi:polyribonucleotide nucleotidyltransferase
MSSTDAVKTVSVEISGTEITFETGKMAKQASGAVVVRSGDTMVLSTATMGNLRDADFLPLTVDIEERMYAVGKIPGSFFKREGRSSTEGTLTARMIDRPLRPLFPKNWRYETQLVGIPLSVDHDHPHDILAMNGASAALMISPVPFPTPVGAVRIGKVDGNFVINPSEVDLAEGKSDLDLVVAGTEEAILMVEAGANFIPEAEILDALDIAHAQIKKLCAAQQELRELAGKEKVQIEQPQVDEALYQQIVDAFGQKVDEATSVEDKLARQDATKAVEAEVVEQFAPDAEDAAKRAEVGKLFASSRRPRCASASPCARSPDGRKETEIRQLTIDAGLLPRAHGSGLFTRGRPRSSASPPSARSRRRCASTRSGSSSRSSTGTTTTSRRSRWARPASCAGPSAATSATARSPSARSSRSCRPRTSSRTRSASSRTRSSPTARRRWRRSAARRWRSWTRACRSRRRSRASRWA